MTVWNVIQLSKHYFSQFFDNLFLINFLILDSSPFQRQVVGPTRHFSMSVTDSSQREVNAEINEIYFGSRFFFLTQLLMSFAVQNTTMIYLY